METFKVGDTVTRAPRAGYDRTYDNKPAVIYQTTNDVAYIEWTHDKHQNGPYNFTDLIIYQIKPTLMSNLVQKVKELFQSEPDKTFMKAGIKDANGVLTAEGQTVFLAYLLDNKFAADFKTDVVDKLLAAEKADK